ncbi:MAG: prepilin peptidase [Candidatus Obscuribacter sp.]|jgi:prepilin signal peptidase PulO-like enzyme (type II secretory pathway)|nr:prepilin peptidase [Candidatus Obscuribacter sp.]MBK7838120.1 prepilin peptidase [Candidatus Obscuribacter sp.]MBK9203627.1 prepilin peptidase [Candidatus Obscuribacter sp.]MBK9622000.1 prepilin peptidase [Candidatus Obscuribacter sp.]MBK9774499.1 prepilin peptidase [Candidatus Obscuribacter sp.]
MLMIAGLDISPQELFALVATAIGAGTDLATRKIYNWLTFPSALIGIALNGYYNGIYTGFHNVGAVEAALGYALAAGIMMFPNPGKRMHFGDVKMMAAVGAILGMIKFLLCMFYFSLCYGLVAMVLILKSIPPQQIKGFWLLLKSFVFAGVDMTEGFDMSELDKAKKKLIPLGPIIFAGCLLAILLDKWTMHFLGFSWYQ